MTASTQPKIKRRLPKVMVVLVSCAYYCIALPINWLLTRVGNKTGILLRKNKSQAELEKKILNAFEQYTPTAHDIFVNTYSKSGTNWMLQMTHQIAFLGEGEFENIHDVVSWPDMHVQAKGKFTIPLTDTDVQQTSPTQLRVIKTHLAAQHIPYNEKARYITVIRDPKDVFVSSYHFVGGFSGQLMPGVDDWLESFLSDNFPIAYGATWAEHSASIWALKDKPNVLVLSFTEMKKDLVSTVKQVVEFMNVELTEAQLEKVITKSSFAYMKGIDNKFLPLEKNALPWMNAQMVRQGKAGNSKELITLDQQRRIDEHFMNELKALGSDFPYAEFCRITA